MLETRANKKELKAGRHTTARVQKRRLRSWSSAPIRRLLFICLLGLRCFRFWHIYFVLSQMSLLFLLFSSICPSCLHLLFQLSNFWSERKPSRRRFLHNSFSCRNLNFSWADKTSKHIWHTEGDLCDLWYMYVYKHIHTNTWMCLYSTYNNRSLEELNFQRIDQPVGLLNAKWEVSLPCAFFILFGFSFFTPTTQQSLALTSIKIQQSFRQLLTHYPCLDAESTN